MNNSNNLGLVLVLFGVVFVSVGAAILILCFGR